MIVLLITSNQNQKASILDVRWTSKLKQKYKKLSKTTHVQPENIGYRMNTPHFQEIQADT